MPHTPRAECCAYAPHRRESHIQKSQPKLSASCVCLCLCTWKKVLQAALARSATVGTVLSHMVPHNSIAHEEAPQLWFPSLLWPTQAQRFLNCAPLINSSNSTLGDLRVVSATHAGSKYVVRKENTYTRVIIICLNVHQGRPVYLYFTPRQAYFSLSDAMLSNSCSTK